VKEPPSLESRALRFLSRREHSRAELQKKLSPHAASTLDLERLLDSLQERGFLSEVRFAEVLVSTRRRRFGAARITHELRQKGVAEELVAAQAVKLQETELQAAKTVWQKKFGRAPRSAEERAKQFRFMHGRGFTAEVVFQILRGKD
jgi:regulatory protein